MQEILKRYEMRIKICEVRRVDIATMCLTMYDQGA